MVGRPDIGETVRRLTAYAAAGADCVYAPGLHTSDQVSAIVGAVAPTAVNVVVGNHFTSVAELAGLGVRRISVGGALARTAWTGFLTAAREMAERNDFDDAPSGVDRCRRLFRDEWLNAQSPADTVNRLQVVGSSS